MEPGWRRSWQPAAGQGLIYCFGVEDADAEHARLAAAGVKIVEEPEDKPWGERGLPGRRSRTASRSTSATCFPTAVESCRRVEVDRLPCAEPTASSRSSSSCAGSRVVTAAELAQELEVSLRTVYRDVQDLLASGVPIEGEAGVGYTLPHGFDLPPLMFDEDEIEALVLGARMVEAWGDPVLARRARAVLSKVETVLPPRLKPRLDNVALFAPAHAPEEHAAKLEPLRRGVNEKLKVRFDYIDASGRSTARTVRPVCLTFWGKTWLVSAWCELRDDFRSFRPDRMGEVDLLAEAFVDEPGKDLTALLERVAGEGR